MAINWGAVKAEYVNHPSLTFASIAKKYGVHPVSLRSRAAKENWTAEREVKATKLLQKATEKSIFDASTELARYNEHDLQAAKALRALAEKRMSSQEPLEARDIRSLAGAIESAQRIARLALGASTENTDTHISEAERMTPEERRERIRQLHKQLFPDDEKVH